VVLARRDTRTKAPASWQELDARVRSLLDDIQDELLARALAFRESHTASASTYEEFKALMDGRPGFVYAYWCGSDECEAAIKAETQATIRNLPFDADADGSCVRCGKPAMTQARFAKAY
jgi:prolyl-tRNA synthetase